MELRRKIFNKDKNFDVLPKKIFCTRWGRYNANLRLIEQPPRAVCRGLHGLTLI